MTARTRDDPSAIGAAYRAKYGRYAASIIDAITSVKARAATLKLVSAAPRS